METLLQDVRYGMRLLRKHPGFSVIAVITLALGIGANTAIFSVVYGVILKPLPFKNPDQLVRIYSEFPTFPGGGLRRFALSPPELLDLKRDTNSWQTLDGWVNGGANLTGSTQPIRVTASYVTGTLLESMGIAPMIGRSINPDDDIKGKPQVAVLSYGLWQRAFGGDRNVVGQELLLDGIKCDIIGVMPKGFEFPPGELDAPELWTPLQIDPAITTNRASHYLYVLGRLKQGVTLTQGRDELSQLVQHYGETKSPKTHAFQPEFHPLIAYPLKDEVITGVRPALLMLAGAVFFVLLIACVNVANLLLARAESRQREIAMRRALGASYGRLARQFVTEGTVLAMAGAAVGLAVAYASLRLMIVTNAGLVPRIAEISLNGKALLFALATCLATGIVFGMAPLVHVATRDLHNPLKASGGRSTASAAAQVFRKALVSGELALALILLVGSGLMVRGFWKLLQVDPGFSPHGLLTMRLALDNKAYPDSKSLISFSSRLQERMSALPGVESAGLVSGLPPARRIDANDTEIEGIPMGPDAPIQNVDYWEGVTPDYFQTMKMRLIEGRFLERTDGENTQPVVVINRAMARHFYAMESPIGRRVRTDSKGPYQTIVGVVADVRNAGLDQPAGTEMYLPSSQAGFMLRNFYVVLRTAGDPTSLTQAATGVIHDLDPSLPVSSVRTMDEVLASVESRPRFLTLVLGLFSVLALVLAGVGIYGLMSYSVTQRTQEIGIRMALGAKSGSVLGMVLGYGMRLTAIGMVVGIGAAIGLTRLMTSLLFGVSAGDPMTFVTVPIVLAIVALGACYIPARRATRVDPIVALRYE